MRLEKFTTRQSPVTGKPYPRCQAAIAGLQCDRTAYSDGLCWGHYRMAAPTTIDGQLKPRAGRPRREGKWTAREKYNKHLEFWFTRPFPKRKGKSVAQMLIEAMDRAIVETDPTWLRKVQALRS